jgi:hypothetical protein
VLEQGLLVLGVVVLRVLGDVAEVPRDADAIRDLAALLGGEILDLFLQLLVTLRSEDHFLHRFLLRKKTRGARAPSRPGIVAWIADSVKRDPSYDFAPYAGRSP